MKDEPDVSGHWLRHHRLAADLESILRNSYGRNLRIYLRGNNNILSELFYRLCFPFDYIDLSTMDYVLTLLHISLYI
jgi:hypothetical protein